MVCQRVKEIGLEGSCNRGALEVLVKDLDLTPLMDFKLGSDLVQFKFYRRFLLYSGGIFSIQTTIHCWNVMKS